MTLLNILYYSILLSALIIAGYVWKKLRGNFKLLGLFVGFTLIIEIAALYIAKNYGANEYIYIIYDLINIAFITWLQSSFLRRRNFKKITFSIGACLIIALIFNIISGKYLTYNNIFTCITNVSFIIYVLVYLLEKIILPAETRLTAMPEFYFSIILLFFCSVSILYWVATNYLKDSNIKQFATSMYYIFLFSNYLYYLGMGFVFYKEAKMN